MSVRESDAFCGELIDIWGGDFSALGVVTTDIAVAEVVGEEDNDVGLIWRRRGAGAEGGYG